MTGFNGLAVHARLNRYRQQPFTLSSPMRRRHFVSEVG
jgi:hypothetical protein